MNKLSKIKDKSALIAGIDLSKSRPYGYGCSSKTSAMIPAFGFNHDQSGLRIFWSRLESLRNLEGLSEIIIGYEPTGSYGLGAVDWLIAQGAKLVQVNPMHVKRLKELWDNSPEKSDAKDCCVIAQIVGYGHGLSVIRPQGIYAELRSLVRARLRYTTHLTRIKNQVESIMAQVFPEFVSVMVSLDRKSSQALLRRYPTPDVILKLGKYRLGQLLKKSSRGRLGSPRAAALYAVAQQSIGVKTGLSSMKLDLSMLMEDWAMQEKHIRQLDQQLEELLKDFAPAKYVRSIKGIGLINAATLLGETGALTAFPNAKALEKLAGLNLYQLSSGKKQSKRKISRRGNKRIRRVLYLASLSLVRKSGSFYPTYQRHLEKGMEKKQALVAIMRKLIKTIFALVNQEQYFDPARVT